MPVQCRLAPFVRLWALLALFAVSGVVAYAAPAPTPASTGFSVKINFQPAGAPIPPGYLADVGAPYGPRGNGYSYGWGSENGPNTRDRNAPNSPDQRYDTFIHTQLTGRASWQIAVPNGQYRVRLVCGDPLFYDSVYKVTAEGALVVNGAPTSQQRWVEGSAFATVADGKLSIVTAEGAVNNKLAFIEISGVTGVTFTPTPSATATPTFTPTPRPGDQPAIAVVPSPVSQTVEARTQITGTLAIRNTGGGTLSWSVDVDDPPLYSLRAALDAGYQAVIDAIPNRFLFTGGETGSVINEPLFYDSNYLGTDRGQLPYSSDVLSTSQSVGGEQYFTRKYPGLFVLAADLKNVQRFGSSGSPLSGYRGTLDGATLETTVDGRGYLGFVARYYGAGWPSVNQLVIVERQPGISQEYFFSNGYGDQTIDGLGQTSRLYYLLYSSSNNTQVTDAQTTAIMRAFLQAVRAERTISVAPSSGSTVGGSASQLALRVDSTRLISGTYRSALTVSSNDSATPRLRVPVTLVVRGAPALTVSPSPLDFGDVVVGQAFTRTLTLTNSGTSDLRLAGASSTLADVTPGALPGPLTPGASATLQVRFRPGALGPQSGSLTIQSNAGTTAVALRGAGAEPPALGVQPSGIEATVAAGAQASRSLTISNGGPGELRWSLDVPDGGLRELRDNLNANYQSLNGMIPNRYDFSDGEVGSSIPGGGLFYRSGNSLLTSVGGTILYSNDAITTSVYLGGGQYFTRKYPGLFIFAGELNNIDSFRVSGNLDGSMTVDAAVLEASSGGRSYLGFVKRAYSDYSPSVNHLIIVERRSGLSHTYDESGIDDYHEIHGLRNSGRLYYLLYSGDYMDDAATHQFMQVFIDQIRPGGPWLDATPRGGTLAPGASATVAVQFDATEELAGSYRTDLRLSSNDPARPLLSVPVALTVTGTPALDYAPAGFDFGTVYVGQQFDYTLAISSTGTSETTITSISSTLDDLTVGDYPAYLSPGDSAAVPLQLTPSGLGEKSGSLVIATSAGTYSLPLSELVSQPQAAGLSTGGARTRLAAIARIQ